MKRWADIIRPILLLCVLSRPALICADNQPPYAVKDPAVQADFENIYLQADKLSLFTANTANGINQLCIDSPTFCVDAVAHQVSLSSGSVNTPALYWGTSPSSGFYAFAPNAIGLTTNSTQRVVFDAVGNILLGPGTSNNVDFSDYRFTTDTTGVRYAAIRGHRGSDAAHIDIRFLTMQGDTEGVFQSGMIGSDHKWAVGGGHTPIKMLDIRGASDGLLLIAPSDDVNPSNDIFQITTSGLSNVFNISKAGGFVARAGSSQVTASGESKFTIEADAASQSATLQLRANNATPGQDTIYFGSNADATIGRVNYDPNSNTLTMQANNTTIFSGKSSGVAILGTNTNDNASTGFVGEYISSAAVNVNAGATDTYAQYASVTLTAGDWQLTGYIELARNGATFTQNYFECFISVNSGTGTGDRNYGLNDLDFNFTGNNLTFASESVSVPGYRASISATTTYYVKAVVGTYSGGPPKINARINAIRVR